MRGDKTEMTVEKISNLELSENAHVRVCKAGNVIEVKYLQHVNNRATVRKLSADFFQVVSTGEVFQYSQEEKEGNRLDNIKSVRKTLAELRRIINHNVTDIANVRWITLTYAENMTDTKQLYKDMDNFRKRLRRYCTKQGYGDIEYINVVEPQGRGAWHCHMLLIFNQAAPFFPNSKLAELWGHGFVNIQALRGDIDNVGAYLSAYLGDLPLDDAKRLGMCPETVTHDNLSGDNVGEVNGKKILKGWRLRLYPKGVNIYRCSRGIKKPPIKLMTEGECSVMRGSAKLTYEQTIAVSDGDFNNIINTRYYNTKR